MTLSGLIERLLAEGGRDVAYVGLEEEEDERFLAGAFAAALAVSEMAFAICFASPDSCWKK